MSETLNSLFISIAKLIAQNKFLNEKLAVIEHDHEILRVKVNNDMNLNRIKEKNILNKLSKLEENIFVKHKRKIFFPNLKLSCVTCNSMSSTPFISIQNKFNVCHPYFCKISLISKKNIPEENIHELLNDSIVIPRNNPIIKYVFSTIFNEYPNITRYIIFWDLSDEKNESMIAEMNAIIPYRKALKLIPNLGSLCKIFVFTTIIIDKVPFKLYKITSDTRDNVRKVLSNLFNIAVNHNIIDDADVYFK